MSSPSRTFATKIVHKEIDLDLQVYLRKRHYWSLKIRFIYNCLTNFWFCCWWIKETCEDRHFRKPSIECVLALQMNLKNVLFLKKKTFRKSDKISSSYDDIEFVGKKKIIQLFMFNWRGTSITHKRRPVPLRICKSFDIEQIEPETAAGSAGQGQGPRSAATTPHIIAGWEWNSHQRLQTNRIELQESAVRSQCRPAITVISMSSSKCQHWMPIDELIWPPSLKLRYKF